MLLFSCVFKNQGLDEDVQDNFKTEYKNKGHSVASCYIWKQPLPKMKTTLLKSKDDVPKI